MANVIEVKDLTFRYYERPVLEDVSFTVAKGDYVGLIGPNGAGKSTLIKLLLGLLKPESGRITLFGQDIRTFTQWPKIGYVPQAGAYTAGFPATALEVVLANMYSQIGIFRLPRARHKEAAMEALKKTGMQGKAQTLIGSLSGGELQRVMIARVLANNPSVMLLDEPMSGVDAASSEDLYELIRRLVADTQLTVIMVSHHTEALSVNAGRLFCIEEGSMIELPRDAINEELQHKHRHPGKKTGTGRGRD